MKKLLLVLVVALVTACSSEGATKAVPYSGYSTVYHNWLDGAVKDCYDIKVLAAKAAISQGATEAEAIEFAQYHYLKCLKDEAIVF